MRVTAMSVLFYIFLFEIPAYELSEVEVVFMNEKLLWLGGALSKLSRFFYIISSTFKLNETPLEWWLSSSGSPEWLS